MVGRLQTHIYTSANNMNEALSHEHLGLAVDRKKRISHDLHTGLLSKAKN